MADPTICTGFLPNSAIFGVGVRIGFYTIGLLAAVTPVKSTFSPWNIREIQHGNEEVQPKREISSIVTVQGINGLGLLITAVIQTAMGKLSLYHAFLIINLLFLLSTSFLYFLFNPNPILRRREFFLFSLILLAIFSFYVGWTARTFGSQPECNDTVKIIWILSVSTASYGWFRNFGIIIFTIYIAVAAIHIVQLSFFRRRTVNLGPISGKALRAYGLVVLAVNVILIFVIEKTISANKVPDNTAWSFGQTLPIVMLIGPFFEVWDDNYPLVKAAWLKRRAARYNAPDTPLKSYIPHSSPPSRPARSGYFAVDG